VQCSLRQPTIGLDLWQLGHDRRRYCGRRAP
jgi:hypothetical protein